VYKKKEIPDEHIVQDFARDRTVGRMQPGIPLVHNSGRAGSKLQVGLAGAEDSLLEGLLNHLGPTGQRPDIMRRSWL